MFVLLNFTLTVVCQLQYYLRIVFFNKLRRFKFYNLSSSFVQFWITF